VGDRSDEGKMVGGGYQIPNSSGEPECAFGRLGGKEPRLEEELTRKRKGYAKEITLRKNALTNARGGTTKSWESSKHVKQRDDGP